MTTDTTNPAAGETDKAATKTAERAAAAAKVADTQDAAERQVDATLTEATAKKDWTNGVIIVADPKAKFPEKTKKVIIVVQGRARHAPEAVLEGDVVVTAAQGTHRNASVPPLVAVDYPEGGDLYLRTGTEADFGELGPVLTIGKELNQAGFTGLSTRPGDVHVGPSSTVYAAVDVAVKRGAEKVQILGLDEAETAILKPWFDEIADRVEITFG